MINKYQVDILETITGTITVNAESKHEADELAKSLWQSDARVMTCKKITSDIINTINVRLT